VVSVVVPTRNRAHLLRTLLAALEAQDYPNYEVIVVDDASEDATPNLLSAWAGGKHVPLRLEASSGSYAARNHGWRAARGDVIAFTDDDCRPRMGWLTALVASLREPDNVGVQGVTRAYPGEITPFTHQIEQRHPGPPYRTCNIAYRRAVLERLGGFDQNMRWYADNILGLRALQLGSIGFAPDAVVDHPPRPRDWRDRTMWLARFRADIAHRRVLRELRIEPVTMPRWALPVLLWIVRPLLKQSWLHARYGLRHPVNYARQLGPMIREKWELFCALREFWLGAAAPVSTPLPPIPERPLVSVVIVTRDRPVLLEGALASLNEQTWTHRETIVVDHAGCPRTRVLAQGQGACCVAAPGATLAAARQTGVAAARGEIVAFTDDDCLADPRWLEALVRAFRRRPELHGIQGQTRAERGPVGFHAVAVSGPNALYQTCNIAYRRAALELAGGLDLRFRGWFEDTSLAARVLMQGPIGFEPRALVSHRAVPRSPLDRPRWRTLLEDEQLLARAYAPFYRRTRGPGFVTTVIARWLLGSPMKTLLWELPRVRTQPRAYLALVRLLLRERVELISALLDIALRSKAS
jgi:glycosyltransferase involved in cell wall biosynthesis